MREAITHGGVSGAGKEKFGHLAVHRLEFEYFNDSPDVALALRHHAEIDAL